MINGFVIIDKQKGITSHDVVDQVRKLSLQRKVGHCGTLDPLATGVLVVALGEATKLTEYFLGCDKAYEATLTLGAVSDTYDADGEILETSKKKIKLSNIKSALNSKFIGTIEQIPPKYSALKIDGKKACDLARKGLDVSMRSRRITVYDINVLSYEWPILKLKIHCSKGTYVRSIAHDLGQELKCGAYLSDLRRTRVAHFDISDALSLPDLNLSFDEYVLPIRDIVSHFGRVVLSDEEYNRLKDGGIIRNSHGRLPGPVFGYYKGKVSGVIEFPENYRMLKFHKKLNIF